MTGRHESLRQFNDLAEKIHYANLGIDLLADQAAKITETLWKIEDAARAALSFHFPSEKQREELNKLLRSAIRARELLNAAELGSRGLVAKNTLEDIYRSIP